MPFYAFKFETEIKHFETDDDAGKDLVQELGELFTKLDYYCKIKHIQENTRVALITLSRKVIDHLTVGHDAAREEILNIMGGKVLEYEAKTIFNEGKAEGKAEGQNITMDILDRMKEFPGEPPEETAHDVGCEVKEVLAVRNHKQRSWK